MKFQIEQVAICPADPEAAIKLLKEMGAEEWIEDLVIADGKVFQDPSSNTAHLRFNYEMFSGKEFEVLEYKSGSAWTDAPSRHNSVCHFGMHCSKEELVEWRKFFRDRRINVAQEVNTLSHNNPHIAGKRFYNYVIFDTKHILGVDVKFIVRKDVEGETVQWKS